MAGFGETLRQARAHKNVTLREAEADTRINRHYLAALEDEEFGALPPPIYSRGIVRKYADYLGLDAGKVLDMHREATGTPREASPLATTPTEIPRMWAPNFAVMAFGVVLTAIVFAWGYSIWLSPPDTTPDDPTTVVTETTTSAATQQAAEARPTPPAAPTQVATEEPPAEEILAGGDNQSGQEAVTEEVVTEEVEQTNQHRTGIGVTVQAESRVVIEVDGQIAYDGVLGAGESTDMIVGTDFVVTTSDGSVSYFFNSCGNTSSAPMANEAGEFQTQFSASEQSCAPPEG